jgi:hypothetical protein
MSCSIKVPEKRPTHTRLRRFSWLAVGVVRLGRGIDKDNGEAEFDGGSYPGFEQLGGDPGWMVVAVEAAALSWSEPSGPMLPPTRTARDRFDIKNQVTCDFAMPAKLLPFIQSMHNRYDSSTIACGRVFST